jgi:hypothetical protein
MSEQMFPLADMQCIIVKFLSNENVKPVDIPIRFKSTVQWWNALKDPSVWLE